MRQLTSLDAQFLALENSRQTGHVGSLAMLDASTALSGEFGIEQVKLLLSERAPQLPPLRWRLAEIPLGLDHPYWVEEAEIDLGYHVREMALASPGTDQQLADQVARIMARPLDRAREGREVEPPDEDLADPSPSTAQMLGLGLIGLPRYPFRMLKAIP